MNLARIKSMFQEMNVIRKLVLLEQKKTSIPIDLSNARDDSPARDFIGAIGAIASEMRKFQECCPEGVRNPIKYPLEQILLHVEISEHAFWHQGN